MTAILLFACTFGLVFALGLQSQFTNNGHYAGAFLNSLAIGSANLFLLKIGPHATGIEIAAYVAGGPFGIVSAMYVFRRFLHRRS